MHFTNAFYKLYQDKLSNDYFPLDNTFISHTPESCFQRMNYRVWIKYSPNYLGVFTEDLLLQLELAKTQTHC